MALPGRASAGLARNQRCCAAVLPGLTCFAITCSAWLAATPAQAQAVTEVALPEPVVVMHMLLERTFLKVDVLTLEVYVAGVAGAEVERLAGEAGTNAVADSIAAVIFAAPVVGARIEFLRGASLSQFVSEVRASMRRAVDAGMLLRDEADGIAAHLPVWYAFLEDRGIRPGDVQRYRISGDTLHTTYADAGGRVLLDQVDVATASRNAVLGSYFAPRSDFRGPLLRSLRTRNRFPVLPQTAMPM